MYFKTYLNDIRYQLKALGIFNLMPLICLYVMLPTANLINYRVYQDFNLLFENILRTNQLCCPVLTVFCTFFLLEHCIEEDGHELLYIRHRWKLPHVWIIYLLFQMLMIPLYLVYARWFSEIWWLYLKLAVIHMFYHLAAYCLSYMFGKITPAIVFLSFVSIAAVLEAVYGAIYYTYFDSYLIRGTELLYELIPYVFFVLIFAIIGSVRNYHFIENYSS